MQESYNDVIHSFKITKKLNILVMSSTTDNTPLCAYILISSLWEGEILLAVAGDFILSHNSEI